MVSSSTVHTGRIIPVVVNDDESELRTPTQPLHSIPRDARDVFAPMPPLPLALRSTCDLTRIAPGRPLAHGQVIEISGRVLDEEARPVRDTLMENIVRLGIPPTQSANVIAMLDALGASAASGREALVEAFEEAEVERRTTNDGRLTNDQ